MADARRDPALLEQCRACLAQELGREPMLAEIKAEYEIRTAPLPRWPGGIDDMEWQ